jgi:hypothetical protein
VEARAAFLQLAACTLCIASTAIHAAPITHYTAAYINSSISVNDAIPDSVTDYAGADSSRSVAGTQTFAYGNGSGGFAFKPETSQVAAHASLATGALKTLAFIAFGTDGVGSSPIPVGHSNGTSDAEATFADSFRFFNPGTTTAYTWSPSDTATFSFTITGDITKSANVIAPTSSPFETPGEPNNAMYSVLRLSVYQAGTLDLVDQYNNFDFNAYPSFNDGLAAFVALGNAIAARRVVNDLWVVGEPMGLFPEVDPSQIIPVTNGVPVTIERSFQPGGDFDWTLDLFSLVSIDASLEEAFASLDFSHTINTGFGGPAGAETYSMSGLFPGTLALTMTGTVPVPSTLWLLALCGGLLAGVRRLT